MRADVMETGSPLREELNRAVDAEVEEVLERARRQAESLLEDARVEQRKRVEQAMERLGCEQAESRRRALSRAQLEGRNALLRLRRESVDQVLETVRENYLQLPSERVEDLLLACYRIGRRQLPKGAIRVRVGPEAKTIGEKLAGEKNVEVAIDKELNGLIMENAAGTVRCDFSLDTLLQRLRSDREAEIEALLFEEENGGGAF